MGTARRTVVFARGGGRFGNQLLRFFHWIAWSMHHGGSVRVVSLPFWPYARHFERWRGSPGCGYPRSPLADGLARAAAVVPAALRPKLAWRLEAWTEAIAGRLAGRRVNAIRTPGAEKLDLTDGDLNARMLGRRWTVCSGWTLSCWPWLAEHATEVRRLFAPADPWRGAADQFLATVRRRRDRLIGLYVRQGDYRTWRGGRYFFPIEAYERWAAELVALHRGENIGILVTSDEPIAEGAFAGLPVEVATGSAGREGHWFESFLELAACDVIVSAPSTFSGCAAFLGDRPIWPLCTSGQILDPSAAIVDHLLGAATHPAFGDAVK